MFDLYEGYYKPIVKKINAYVNVAVYMPMNKEKDIMIGISNIKTNSNIILYYSTLVLCNKYIKEIIHSSLINNKENLTKERF